MVELSDLVIGIAWRWGNIGGRGGMRMPTVKDVEPGEPELDLPGAEREPVGRIIHDERGNAIWKWFGDTSSSGTGTGSGVLKHLNPDDLEVEGQADEAITSRTLDPGGGYDPYNQTRRGPTRR
jgi:hypothetical protein